MRLGASKRLGDHGDDAFALRQGLFDLPVAGARFRRRRRQQEHDGIGLKDHLPEALLPSLSTENVLAVDAYDMPEGLKCRHHLIRGVEVLP